MIRDDLRPKSLLRRMLYPVVLRTTEFYLYPKLMRHLAWFEGIENLPAKGAVIVIANHQSYFDSMVVAGLIRLLYGRRTVIPTKVKAFKGVLQKIWHEASNGLPIDPRRPEEAYQRMLGALKRGEILIVYPEGERSDGSSLLPFKFGGFNLSVQTGVPIVPVGLRRTGQVLPKGSYRFVAGEKASATFGELLDPNKFIEAAGGLKELAAARMRDDCRERIQRWVYDDVVQEPDARERKARCVDSAVRAIEWQIEAVLDQGVENITAGMAQNLLRNIRHARALTGKSLGLDTCFVRSYGFWLMARTKPIALLSLPKLHRRIRTGLASDPDNPYLNYSLGQFHLQVPFLFGGRTARAVEAFRRAYDRAEAYGYDPARFVYAYAKALCKLGRIEIAIGLLERHFSAVQFCATPRLARRRERALHLLAESRAMLTELR